MFISVQRYQRKHDGTDSTHQRCSVIPDVTDVISENTVNVFLKRFGTPSDFPITRIMSFEVLFGDFQII